ncbi:MAG: MFS transporter [Actinomycetota bacterium]|nr:MFS transporter [Actinomycetota bacterium]
MTASAAPGPRAGPGRSPAGPFRLLWSASAASNLGDGINIAALPLLAATLTRDPLAVAGVAFAGRLPWLMLALPAGAVVDRLPRARLMTATALVRATLMSALAAATLAGVASMGLVYVVALGLGVSETLYDTSIQSSVPLITPPGRLQSANSRLLAGEIATNQFAGPALGGALFSLGAWWAGLGGVGAFCAAALAAATFARRAGLVVTPRTSGRRAGVGRDVLDGLIVVWRNDLLRAFAVLLAAMSVSFTMGSAILVLFAVGEDSVLGLGSRGYVALLMIGALGSAVGSMAAGRVASVFGRPAALWFAVLVFATAPVVVGVTSDATVVAGVNCLWGFSATLWMVTTTSSWQAMIPDAVQGRVAGIYRFAGWGAAPIGSLVGGLLARWWGLRAPWFAAAAIVVAAAVPALRVIRTRSFVDALDGPHRTAAAR